MGDKFAMPNVNKVCMGEHSLRSFGPVVWNNMLPEKCKGCISLNQFRNSIKCWVPDNCPCTLCKNYIKGLGYIKIYE